MQPAILLLKEGTDTSQGRGQLISNINACQAVVEIVKSTLGPRGMDKMIVNSSGNVTVSNDGATVMKLLDIVHPAAKTLVEIAKSQDDEVGDGTTSVVVVAGELLKEAKQFVEDGVHSRIIIKGFRQACQLAVEKYQSLAVDLEDSSSEEARNDMLTKCAATALNSKLVASHKDFFAKMVVDSVLKIEDNDDSLIGVKKETGGALEDSFMVDGVAFKKTFSYAGFEQQPKYFKNPKIICLNIELELKNEKENAEVRVKSVADYEAVVDAEWQIIYNKLEKIVETGANVVLSRLAIGDLATQYFADRKIFCAGRVQDDDLRRMCKATGASVQTTATNVPPEALGTCEIFEEKQVGGSRYNLFTGCPQSKTATLVLRGGGDHFIDEAERSIHDAICITRRVRKHHSIVAGGGAAEMEVSRHLREVSRGIRGKQQLIVASFAKALEVVPRMVANNAGFDSVTLLNKLRHKHAQDGCQWYGIDVENEGICNTLDSLVWEPTLVKTNSIQAATEAACMILAVDQTIKDEPAQAAPQGLPGQH